MRSIYIIILTLLLYGCSHNVNRTPSSLLFDEFKPYRSIEGEYKITQNGIQTFDTRFGMISANKDKILIGPNSFLELTSELSLNNGSFFFKTDDSKNIYTNKYLLKSSKESVFYVNIDKSDEKIDVVVKKGRVSISCREKDCPLDENVLVTDVSNCAYIFKYDIPILLKRSMSTTFYNKRYTCIETLNYIKKLLFD